MLLPAATCQVPFLHRRLQHMRIRGKNYYAEETLLQTSLFKAIPNIFGTGRLPQRPRLHPKIGVDPKLWKGIHTI